MADHRKESPRNANKPLQQLPHIAQTATPIHPTDSITTNVVATIKNIKFSNHRLQVTNLPLHITPEQLGKYYPGNIGIKIKEGQKKGAEAVVTFRTPEEFERAFQETRRISIDGRPLVVSPKLQTDRDH